MIFLNYRDAVLIIRILVDFNLELAANSVWAISRHSNNFRN